MPNETSERDDGTDTLLDIAADRIAAGLLGDLDHALADPIVRIVADTIDRERFVALLRAVALRLKARLQALAAIVTPVPCGA